TNYSGVAKSVDEGVTWDVIEGLRWPGDSNFIQVAPYRVQVSDETAEIYFWCIPAGRLGDVKLMKVNENDIEHLSKYMYYAGLDEEGKPIWSEKLDDAVLVVDDEVGV